MAEVPKFDPWAVDCPQCGSFDVVVTDHGWTCPHCKGSGGPECVATFQLEIAEEADERGSEVEADRETAA